MAKFSMLRDDDEDDEEFFIRSPKRRRTSHTPSTAQTTADDDEPQIHPQRDTEIDGGDHDHHHHRTESSMGPTKSGSMTVILSDPDVLDCSICFEPFTIPVFQCNNGHIACSSCCTKLDNKCPSCSEKIGYNRCRAIEKVVESARVTCCYLMYGCKEIVSYHKKHEHEETCFYAPCSCPFPDCLFRGSSTSLSRHMSHKHADIVVRFLYNSIFSVCVKMDGKFVVLQEEKSGILFILTHGNTVDVKCIDPSLSRGRFPYELVLRKTGSSLRFQSFTQCTTGQVSDPHSMDYFLVPGYFYDNGGRLKLEICIWSKDA